MTCQSCRTRRLRTSSRKVREQDYSARQEIETVRLKKGTENLVHFEKKSEPVTYPLGFKSTEKNLVQARTAMERYTIRRLNGFDDQMWGREVVNGFQQLRKVNPNNEENTGYG
jgi:hypothetical protein